MASPTRQAVSRPVACPAPLAEGSNVAKLSKFLARHRIIGVGMSTTGYALDLLVSQRSSRRSDLPPPPHPLGRVQNLRDKDCSTRRLQKLPDFLLLVQTFAVETSLRADMPSGVPVPRRRLMKRTKSMCLRNVAEPEPLSAYINKR